MPNRKTQEQFINDCLKLHKNKYDYSLVKYINNRTHVTIICPKHGKFKQTPYNHLTSCGCTLCGHERAVSTKSLTHSQFIEKSKQVHGETYDYSETKYVRCKDKVKIICPKHGGFYQRADQHLLGSGCPICNESKGEQIIRLWFVSHQIPFTPQKKFDDCRHILPLPFDFHIDNTNILIEFDGKQHFEPHNFLSSPINSDKIKNKWAKANGYNLIRIPYTDKDYIPDILEQQLRGII